MLMHDLEVLCNEPWCCILCWQFDMQFSYATHLAHPVLCRPTHFNISGYASDSHIVFKLGSVIYSNVLKEVSSAQKVCIYLYRRKYMPDSRKGSQKWPKKCALLCNV